MKTTTNQITLDDLFELIHDEANPEQIDKQYWYGYAYALVQNGLISSGTYHHFTQFISMF